MKLIYKEPEIEIFMFNKEDQLVASAASSGNSSDPEDPMGDANSYIDWWYA